MEIVETEAGRLAVVLAILEDVPVWMNREACAPLFSVSSMRARTRMGAEGSA